MLRWGVPGGAEKGSRYASVAHLDDAMVASYNSARRNLT